MQRLIVATVAVALLATGAEAQRRPPGGGTPTRAPAPAAPEKVVTHCTQPVGAIIDFSGKITTVAQGNPEDYTLGLFEIHTVSPTACPVDFVKVTTEVRVPDSCLREGRAIVGSGVVTSRKEKDILYPAVYYEVKAKSVSCS